MQGYRRLTIETATDSGDIVDLTYSDVGFGIEFEKKKLREWGVEPDALQPGVKIYIKGKEGNKDVDFWGYDKVADVKIASAA